VSDDEQMETATLAGGCFWCLEAVFERVEGVLDVRSGYAGGQASAPSYEEVCSGVTGHAEVVRVRFDPSVIPYRDVLEIFFAVHDPTTPNRQGADVGTQYRSAIFYESEAQRDTARDTIRALEAEAIWDAPVVTEVAPLQTFWSAEEYHREYFRRNPDQPYCQVVVAPKVAKLRKRFSHRMKRDR
jgi:peptide-methionine (S)-S-oxide reductase